VPVPIPTTDGRLFAEGLVLMTYVEGGPPKTEADWCRVADVDSGALWNALVGPHLACQLSAGNRCGSRSQQLRSSGQLLEPVWCRKVRFGRLSQPGRAILGRTTIESERRSSPNRL